MKLQTAPSKKDIFWTGTVSVLEKGENAGSCRCSFYQGVRLKEVFVKIVDCTHLFLMVQHRHFDLPKCRLIISSLPS